MAETKKLYRVVWFADDSGEETETLGFIYAVNDEQAFIKWQFPRSATTFKSSATVDSFYSVEQMEEEERLRDVLDDCPALAQLPDGMKWNIANALALTLTEKNTMETVDLTPTWSQILPALLALLETPNTRQTALDELARMASLADEQVAFVKLGEQVAHDTRKRMNPLGRPLE